DVLVLDDLADILDKARLLPLRLGDGAHGLADDGAIGVADGGDDTAVLVGETADMSHAAAMHADDGDAQGVGIAPAYGGRSSLRFAASRGGAGQNSTQQRGLREKITPVD